MSVSRNGHFAAMVQNELMAKGRDKRKRVAKRRQAANVPRAEVPPGDLLSGDPDAFVRVPLKPKPHLSSGAIEIPEPEEVQEEIAIRSASRLQ
jgi:hypothetical protein